MKPGSYCKCFNSAKGLRKTHVGGTVSLAVLATFVICIGRFNVERVLFKNGREPPVQDLASQVKSKGGKILVFYHLLRSDARHLVNLRFFLENGVADHDMVDYWFVTTRGTHSVLPKRANIKLHVLDEACECLTSCPLSLLSSKLIDYSHFFFITSQVRGPFLPPHFATSTAWIALLVKRVKDEVKMVGASVKCHHANGHQIPYMNPNFFLLDRNGLEVALGNGHDECRRQQLGEVDSDVALTSTILYAGFGVGVLHKRHSNIDWNAKSKNPCEPLADHGSEDITSPFEVMFVEYGSNVTSPMVENYGKWKGTKMYTVGSRIVEDGQEVFLPRRSAVPQGRHLHVHLVTHSLQMQGAPMVLYDLATRLAVTKRYILTVSSLHPGPFQSLWEKAGISVQLLSDDVVTEIGLQAEKSDVTLLNTMVMAPVVKAFPPHLLRRTIWVIHESEARVYEEQFPDIKKDLLRKPERVLFVSHATRALYSTFDYGQFRTIPNWIDVPRVQAQIAGRQGEMRRRLGIPRDAFVITSIGTICERKDQITLLIALKRALSSNPSLRDFVRIVIVGKDGTSVEYEEKLDNFISKEKLGKYVHVLPATTDVYPFFADSNLHVSSSLVESLPLNIMEAMAAGVPVVSTSTFGVLELIRHKESGVLVKPKDVKSLSQVIEHSAEGFLGNGTMQEQFLRFAKVAQNDMKEHFHPKTAMRSYEYLFREVYNSWANSLTHVNKVCVIVRTSDLHEDGFYRLSDMLRSLVDQENPNWEAMVVNTEKKPFVALPSIIGRVGDPRIRIMRLSFSADNPMLSAFDLVDKAISHCSLEASWLLVTDGAYRYMPSFLSQVDSSGDIMAMDWYGHDFHAQSQAKFGRLCARWRWEGCVDNTLRLRQTELGANLLNLQRWRRENRTFADLPQDLDQGSRMIDILVSDEW
eukprot:CAMPEP_0177588698 /NCGR_PEP_ID=MMETSP0419_2-20121207/6371_1 /TAXON_ID=582737 /ORGANISM="Tetraselmis sp., Strain GSL018" /LENGTH=922 /DNA_ID=CAMNT_0019078927 /DNA_START=285 /DNA_END=3050 /DNA_ORIENTATION=-